MLRTLRWFALPAILLMAIGLRFWRIDTLPPGFHFDESFEGLEAWRILTDPSYRPIFLTGNFGVTPFNAYANALMFGLFRALGSEVGPVAMRVTAACFGVLGVLAIFGLAIEIRQLDKTKMPLSPAFPLFAAATLAVMRWHIHFSRMGIEPILVPLTWTAATWLLLRGWRTGHWSNFVGCGVVLAAGMYTYQGAWIIPFIILLTVLYLVLNDNWRVEIGKWRLGSNRAISPISNLLIKQRIGLLLAAVVAALLFAPLAWFFWQHWELVFLRPTQLAIVSATGSPADTSVWHNLWATAKLFGPFGSPGDLDPRRNLPGAPALNLWLAIPFYLGVGLAIWRIRRPAYAIILTSLAGLVVLGIFSEYAPHFHRILGAAAPTALLCAVGFDWLWQSPFLRKFGAQWVCVLLLVLGGATSAQEYFVRWAALPDLFYAFDDGIWQVGQTVAALPADQPIYLTPRTADHPTLAFAWQTQGRPAPVTFDGRYIFPLAIQPSPQPEGYIVIEHEDFRTGLLLPEVFPGATIGREWLDRQGKVYARFYQRNVGELAQRPPQQPLSITLGDGIELAGYDVQPAQLHAGEILYLQLHWQTTSIPGSDWTVFTHVTRRDDAGNSQVMAGRDSLPGNGSLPTRRWQAGWRILDEYQISLPADLAPGEYGVAVGLYQATGERLPADEAGILLGTVTIE